jgi:3-oxoacyl-(acyl-carrier-protein) synthase
MEAFIRGIGIISPQNTFNTKDFLTPPVFHHTRSLACIEPSYKEFLSPVLARRMSRIIKMSIAASTVCLQDAGIDMPDAIMSGTALGCLEDTEKFLWSIIENEEQFLTPTSFMQSTHNTVTAQIALQLKCMNYNFTYVHKAFSFESAVMDGLMTIAEGNGNHILVGGHDEMTEKYFRVCDRVGYWKKEIPDTQHLLDAKTDGSIAGEGSAFFVLSNEVSDRNYAKLRGLKTIYKPAGIDEMGEKISTLLQQNGLLPDDIDIVIYGANGDLRFDNMYTTLEERYFQNSAACYFKHLCGEYQTSGSFAMWMGAMMLKQQTIPACTRMNDKQPKQIKNILIVNGFMNTDYSVYLLSAC